MVGCIFFNYTYLCIQGGNGGAGGYERERELNRGKVSECIRDRFHSFIQW